MDNDKFQELVLEQLASMDKFQNLVLENFDNVFNHLDSLEKSQLKLEMRVENEVIGNIKALLDGYKTHEEKFDRVEERLNRIEDKMDDMSTDVQYLVARVTRIEKLAK